MEMSACAIGKVVPSLPVWTCSAASQERWRLRRSSSLTSSAKVQEVLGLLMFERIDPAMLQPPPKPERPKAASRAWGKGTVDYSKWDHLDDEEEEDEEPRFEEVHQS